MSKLASGVQSKNREDLEALVAMGDTSVPGIEMSDLNDGDILTRTRENVNTNGQFQFVYIPESGEPITSDWIGQDFKKKVLRGWVDGVKDALIGRGQAGLREAKEAAIEEKLKALQKEQLEDDETAVSEVVVSAPSRQVVRQTDQRTDPPRLTAQSSDPTSYVEDQLEITRERLRAAEQAQQDITREVLTARRDYEKWKILAAALNRDTRHNDGVPGVGSEVPSGVPVHRIVTDSTRIRNLRDAG
jgi:hypothetical protein